MRRAQHAQRAARGAGREHQVAAAAVSSRLGSLLLLLLLRRRLRHISLRRLRCERRKWRQLYQGPFADSRLAVAAGAAGG